MICKRGLLVKFLALTLVALLSVVSMAKKGEEVEVKARVGGQIQIEVESGSEVNFEVDPIDQPEDSASTELLVKTNARRYSIVATLGSFDIGDYDLIENEKFFVRSEAPGSGQAINGWEVPQKGEIPILRGEDGRTTGEVTLVEYLLKVDFSVPPGEGKLLIAYTAMAAF